MTKDSNRSGREISSDRGKAGLVEVSIIDARPVAAGIRSLRLARTDGGALPPAGPGSHIDVHLPSGQIRQYSLIWAEDAPAHFEIAIAREETGRGGSREIHDRLKTGDRLLVGEPRNSFPLLPAPHHVFLAGGIGITPILSMARYARCKGFSWELHYACRSREHAAFLQDAGALGEETRCYFSADGADARLDMARVLAAAPEDSHFYCCGPSRMLTAFEALADGIPAERVHIERFAPSETALKHGGFWIDLHRTRRSLFVPSGKSILTVLLEIGIEVSTSCELGLCGTCEVAVLAGIPDHRDDFLSAAERAANKRIMVCCSGAVSERLLLDI